MAVVIPAPAHHDLIRRLQEDDAAAFDAAEDAGELDDDDCTTCRNTGTVWTTAASCSIPLPCPDCWRGDTLDHAGPDEDER